MTFQPGHKLSPGRRHGSRNKRTAEIFNRLEERGDLDPAELLSSIVTNNQEPQELRIQAAGLLMPYKYSKCGTAPVQVYIDVPLDTPEFTHLSDAEQFLAKVAALVAHGQLDFQAGQNLSALAKNWIDAQYARDELQFKINPPETRDQTIRIEGGLPPLPGTNVTMPVLDHEPATNGHALEPPKEFIAAPDEPGKNSTNAGQEPQSQGS
jgi:hypothetical protein